jgi:hypothetical protein
MNSDAHRTVDSGRRRFDSVWLATSLLVNGMLIWAITRETPTAHFAAEIPQRPMRLETNSGADRANTPGMRAGRGGATEVWAALEAGDYAGAVARLRAAHCPEETIQDLVALRMSREALRSLEVQVAERRKGEAWWRSYASGVSRADRRDELDARARLEREFESLFGTSYARATAEFFPWRRADEASPIQAEHREAYDALMSRHRAERDAILGKGAFESLLDDRLESEMAALKERQRMEVERLLTPEELEGLSLRESESARAAKKYLPEAQTEDQFRVMVRVAKELGVREVINPMPGEDQAHWAARANELTAGYRYRVGKILGEPVLKELERLEQARQARLEAREADRLKPRP